MKHALANLLRILALAAILFVCFVAAALLALPGVAHPPASQTPVGGPPAAPPPSIEALGMPLYCLLVSAVFVWTMEETRLRRWGAVLALAIASFGIGTLLPQIESLVFLQDRLAPSLVFRLLFMGALASCLFAPAVVLVTGRFRAQSSKEAIFSPRGTAGEWAARVLALSFAYVVLYFVAGYFIAYGSPEVVAYYKDTHAASFLAQLIKVWAASPWLYGLQLLRGALWIACIVPIVLSFRGGRLELALLLASLFTVFFVILLAPNPIMPLGVRLAHLCEIASSNLVFGSLAGLVLFPLARHS